MRVRPVYDEVLVEVEAEWKGEIKTKSGVIGVTFENQIVRSVGAIRTGKVVAVPRALSQHFHVRRIQERIEVGDIIYFHFNSIDEHSRMEVDVLEKPLYTVSYTSIFCYIRDGKLTPVGSRVLAKPMYDDDVVLEDGIRVRKTKSGIITELNVKHNLRKAKLAKIGKPLDGDKELPVEEGDTIYYAHDADFENEIEGETYFVFLQEDILMKEI